jgi:hypothetical protein
VEQEGFEPTMTLVGVPRLQRGVFSHLNYRSMKIEGGKERCKSLPVRSYWITPPFIALTL